MPIISKYSQDRQDALTDELLAVLEQHQAPADLALMALGNTVNNVLDQQVAPAKRRQLAEQFAKILLQSTDSSISEQQPS